MTLNSRPKTALKLFLPLISVSIALVAGELKANAKEPSTVQNNVVTTKGAALLGQPSIDINQTQVRREFSTDSRFTLAQSTTTPSETVPGRAVPGSTPSGTPSNPADVTPSTTTPSTIQTTPSTTTPGSTPITPSNTPGTTPITPSSTPGTTTPETTPITPSTTPTTPGTTVPTTPTTPDTTTPVTPDTTAPTTPGTTQEFAPGRATRSGSSYVGIGGNIGIGNGDISLGQGSFTVLSKIGLTRNISVRPSVLINDDVAILVPITYDFSFGEGPTGGLGFTAAPFLGVGAAISTGDGGDVGLLLTGGVDVPISSQFTATASVNASVTGQSAVGIMLGVGYNFAGF
ncbi:hypothetical protein LEP3755_24880 [Leptolyngbya sp. NIES-3755]|nr:hypothetical protein LEP3755_24880 [Leptolyngbya sp. NIES-3755]